MKRRFNKKQLEVINNTIENINNDDDLRYSVKYHYDDNFKHHVLSIETKDQSNFDSFQPYNYDCCIGFLMGMTKAI